MIGPVQQCPRGWFSNPGIDYCYYRCPFQGAFPFSLVNFPLLSMPHQRGRLRHGCGKKQPERCPTPRHSASSANSGSRETEETYTVSPVRLHGQMVALITLESLAVQHRQIQINMDILQDHRYEDRNETIAYFQDIQYSQNEILEQEQPPSQFASDSGSY